MMQDLCDEAADEAASAAAEDGAAVAQFDETGKLVPVGEQARMRDWAYQYRERGWHGSMAHFLAQRIREADHYETHHCAPDGRHLAQWPYWATVVWDYYMAAKAQEQRRQHERQMEEAYRVRRTTFGGRRL